MIKAIKKKNKERKYDKSTFIMGAEHHRALPPTKSFGMGPGRSQQYQVSSKSVPEYWLHEGSKPAIFVCLTPSL